MLDSLKLSTSALDEEKWLMEKIGRLSASDMGKLICDGSEHGKFSKGGLTYLTQKTQEVDTSAPAKEKWYTDATLFGQATEPEAIEYFCKKMNLLPLRNLERNNTQHLVIQDELSSCTPDILVYDPHLTPETIWDSTGRYLKVKPVEIKCPPSDVYIKLFACNTPAELKKAMKLYYWQVMTQMLFCDSLVAYFAVYSVKHIDTMKIIVFNKAELIHDFRILKATIEHAKQYIIKNSQRQSLKAKLPL